MRKTLCIGLLLLMAINLYAQQGRVTGTVRDAESGESLIGVAVLEPKLKTGVTTNEKGVYEIELPTGSHVLQFSYLGFHLVNTARSRQRYDLKIITVFSYYIKCLGSDRSGGPKYTYPLHIVPLSDH